MGVSHAERVSFLTLLAAGVLSMLLSSGGSAAGINLFGNWSTEIGLNTLTGGIGTDYASPIESDSGQAAVEISDTGGGPWRVWVRQDGPLPSGVTLAVRRSGLGNGVGSISEGNSYVALSQAEQLFFSGEQDRAAITLQLALFGVSISHPPGSNGCSVIYRVSQP